MVLSPAGWYISSALRYLILLLGGTCSQTPSVLTLTSVNQCGAFRLTSCDVLVLYLVPLIWTFVLCNAVEIYHLFCVSRGFPESCSFSCVLTSVSSL